MVILKIIMEVSNINLWLWKKNRFNKKKNELMRDKIKYLFQTKKKNMGYDFDEK